MAFFDDISRLWRQAQLIRRRSRLASSTSRRMALRADDVQNENTAHQAATSGPLHLELNKPPEFDATLEALSTRKQATGEPLIAGSIAVIGLEDIKDILGARWEQVSEEIIHIAATSIQANLDADDMLRIEGDGRFLVCFAQPDPIASESKARNISRIVKTTLLRKLPEYSASLTVREFVAEIPISVIASGSGSLTERLRAAMANLRHETDIDRERYRRQLLHEFHPHYGPVWDRRNERLAMNRCLTGLVSLSPTFTSFQVIADATELADTLAELDCLVFTRAIANLQSVRRTQPGTSVLVPIRFETLWNVHTRHQIAALLDKLPDSYRTSIALEVTSVPETATSDMLLTVLDTLSGYSDRLLVEIMHPKFLSGLNGDVVWGISRHVGSDGGQNVTKLNRLIIRYARRAKLATIAHCANSVAQGLAAIELNFDYVDGTAIHLSVDMPKSPTRYRPSLVSRSHRIPR